MQDVFLVGTVVGVATVFFGLKEGWRMAKQGSRIVYFFDGFNFFHSLRHNYRKYLWLDYWKFAEVLTPKTRTLKNVVLFTAYPKWLPESHKRHKTYLSALRARNVEIIWGKFYLKERKCHSCGSLYKTHEEKQTDVNIATNLLTWAIQDRFDEIVIGTADSDLIPAIKALNSEFPHKLITILFPIGRKSIEMAGLGLKTMRTRERNLRDCQLPDKVFLPDGSIVSRPLSWR